MKTKLLLLLLLASFSINAQTNLVLNGAFEKWSGNTSPNNWTTTNAVYQISDTQGSYVAKLFYNAASPKVTTQVPMKAGVTYTVKFRYKYVSSNYSGQHPIALNISQTGSGSTLSTSAFATNNLWTEKVIEFTADSDLSYDLSISTFSFDGQSFEVLIDAVQVYVKGTEQYTAIPSLNFEKKLIALGYDSGATDGKVPTININELTFLDVSNSAVGDLTGIQDFVSLTGLDCSQTGLTTLDVGKNINLTRLDCHGNSLKTLNVSKNVNLSFLSCESNYLESIDVKSNIALKYLLCGNNGGNNAISSLDVSQNINLLELRANGQKLSTIDVSKNTALKGLDVSSNLISSLNLSSNPNLESLMFSNNKLSTLDISNNKLLKYLECSSNELTSLDLSKHTSLIFLNCFNNKLKSLNIKNGNNANFELNDGIPFTDMYTVMSRPYYSSFLNNVDLTCIQVDNTAYSNTAWSSIKNAFTYYNTLDCSLSTIIVDPKFEDKLIALQIDKDGKNGSVLNSSINSVTALDLSNSSITDLSGIEGFTALKSLNVSGNALKKLDISKNTALITLNTSGNPALTCIQVANLDAVANWNVTKDNTTTFNIDCNIYTLIPNSNFEDYLISLGIDRDGKNGKVITENIQNLSTFSANGKNITDFTGIQDFKSLTSLFVENNKATKIDVSKNTALKTLSLYGNKLSDIDVSKNTALTYLNIDDNLLTSINLTKNTELTTFSSSGNKLTNIDVSQNTKLNNLWISLNSLASLDVSKNLELIQLSCGNNQIRTLDLSKNTKLTSISIGGNKLVNLNLKNGNNTIVQSLYLVGNPNLTCIQVDDVAYANKNWADRKDATATYSSSACPTIVPYTLIPDSNFEDKLIAIGIDKDGKNGKVESTSIAVLGTLNVSNSNIKDLTGIEDFASLTSLDCSSNQLKTINVAKNIVLTKLNVSKNQLTTLDVSTNALLDDLNISNNAFTFVSVYNNPRLSRLNCSNNAITSLSISDKANLTALSASFNKIRTLDVSKNTMLKELDCASNDMYNLNLQNGNNVNMQGMIFGNFTENPNLLCIQVDDAAFSNDKWIAKDAIASYSTIACGNHTGYTPIPDSKFEDKLIALQIDKDGKNGKVATMSINNVTALNVSNSEISDLTGISDFTSLASLDVSNNALTKIDLSKNLALTNVNVTKNQLSILDLSKNTKLTILSASFNKIESLDVSKNTALKEIDCASNNMYNLNLKNGNNVNMQRVIFGNFTENPNLLCIQVDDAAFSNQNWIAKDATASYSSQACPVNLRYTLIPDPNFEKLLIASKIDTDGENGKVLTSNISKITYLNLYDATIKVSDLTGIQDFTSLSTLYCYSAALTSLDLSKNVNLTMVDFSTNKLTSVDLSANTNLTTVVAYNNQLTSLDVSKNTALKSLSVYRNKLTGLNISKNIALTSLDASSNQISDLDISTNTNLTKIDVFNNQLTSLDFSKNLLLKEVRISNNKFENINVSNLNALTSLSASDNLLTTIDISQNTGLLSLEMSNNKLSVIDISSNTALTALGVSNNQLKTLDITKNKALVGLYANNNQLTSLDMRNGKNTSMQNYNLSLVSNPQLYCILVDDVTFANTNWSSRKDAIAKYNTECTGELNLASNNFAIETKGESCLGENNGEISIVGKASFAYNATINDKSYTFTNNALKVSALAPGVYKVKITIPEMIFEQNFNITIQKGATITGKSDVSAKTVNVEITEGTAPFSVFVDGAEQFQTTDNNFTVSLDKAGLVEVATAKACEGVFAKKVTSYELGTMLSAYPNPTSGSIEIEIPSSKTEVVIDLYNFSGQLVSHGTYNIESGRALLNLEKLPSGIYAAKINLETPEYIKIIKN
ncbi:leucine-rich repeat domain-containing protein [Flavobacterium sp. LPB0248]|uniref:T9SS type A sorting domain-containing protein n=1 Tax=Flavobacterium sp. LPB0248 TaxID=2614441 RepID=UPI0015A68FAD|nr:T9SS type A sorting domain-containing protein [Flavobacterium sp. LPB0248]QLC66671.1 leucine-rich repeat domain-containing protein [Flavobacterium sp. LPB0248]